MINFWLKEIAEAEIANPLIPQNNWKAKALDTYELALYFDRRYNNVLQ